MTALSCTTITVIPANITVTVPSTNPAGASVYLQTTSGRWQLLGIAPVSFSIAANSAFSVKLSLPGYNDAIISGTAGASNMSLQTPVLSGIPLIAFGPVTVDQSTVFPGSLVSVSIPINNTGTGDYPGGSPGHYLSVNGSNVGVITVPPIAA